MTDQTREEWLREFINHVEKLAFEMPAPNIYTPRFMELCVAARSCLKYLLTERDGMVLVSKNKLEHLIKALKFYADDARYKWWTYKPGERLPEAGNGHWVFDSKTWGSAAYHAEPPKEAKDKPWIIAKNALAASKEKP